jgi:flagellar assembly protein FliH
MKKARLLLQEEAGRSLLFSKKILKNSEATLYTMPTLEDNGRASLQSIEERQRLGYEKGFASGEKAGFGEGEEKVSILIERLSNIIQEITEFRDGLIKETEGQVVDLSAAIARKIISDEVTINPEILLSIVTNALKKMQRKGTITIKINPALHELFSKNHASLLGIHEEIIFDTNEKIPVTGPLVIGQNEEVETDLDSMVANVVEQIKGKGNGDDRT